MNKQTEGVEAVSQLDPETHARLAALSTATISMALMKEGLRNHWVRGARPLDAGAPRVVGPAFTMRFIPGREDLSTLESLSSPRSTRGAIEEMPAGCVAVVDAMGITDAGILGDILCARMRYRGVAALLTDGAVRDLAGVKAIGLPIWCNGVASPPSVARFTFVGWQEPVGCGGVAVLPGDVIVLDGDGAVAIPAAMVGRVVETGSETELLDTWMMGEVEKGRRLPGLYPPNEEARAEYEAWRRSRGDKS